MIDWQNLTMMVGPRFRQIMASRNDRERLCRVRKGPKKHSTNKERSYAARTKAAKVKQAVARKAVERQTYHWAAIAYWRGESDEHPL